MRDLAYDVLGRTNDALAEYRRVTESGTAEIDTDCGEVLIANGRPQDAISIYAARIKNDPRYWPAHVGLARAELALGRPAEAARRFAIAAGGDTNDSTL